MSRPTAPLLAALLLVGCSPDTSERAAGDREPAADTSRSSSATPPRVTMGTTTRLAVSPNVVESGGQMVVRFEIRNDFSDTLTLTQGCSAPARVAIRAYGAAPGSPALETTTCRDTLVTQTVPPNASVVLQFPTRAAVKSQPLASGVYVVEATPTITQANGRPFVISPVTTEFRVR